MRAVIFVAVAVAVSAIALGGCTQDENSSNAERETHMGDIRAASTASATATTIPNATATPTAVGTMSAPVTATPSATPSGAPARNARADAGTRR